jgi:hypothetical protein
MLSSNLSEGGRGRGRGFGRGRGRLSGRSYIPPKAPERELKFSPIQYQANTQGATYATVKDAIIQQIEKTYKGGIDIGQSLEDMKEVDLISAIPIRVIATSEEPEEKLVEQAGLDIMYDNEVGRYPLREGLNKAYALIFTTYCTKQMQARIEQLPDYESKLKHKPIAVLEAIQTLMHDPIRAQYPLVSMTDHLVRLLTTKQRDNESLLDFVKRFKQTRDVAKSQLGSTFLNEFVEHQSNYKQATANKFIANGWHTL